MRIGLMSDTHGNLEYLHDVAEFMVTQANVDVIYHLGDDYADAPNLLRHNVRVVNVPGIYCPEYHNKQIPRKRIEIVEGKRFLLVHDPNDIDASDLANADVVCHGHTHRFSLSFVQGKPYINPGHLKDVQHKNRPAAFAMIDVSKDSMTVSFYDINKQVIHKEKFDFV